MHQTAVIYQSKYGHAKTYAQWIAGALEADLFEGPKPGCLDRYDTLIFGGGLYAGGISGAKLLTANFDRYKDKNLLVFTVGLSPTADPSVFKPTIDRSFPSKMQERIRFFHLRGGIDYARLSPVHKSMMGMMRFAVSKKKDKSDDDRMLLETYGGRVDFCDRQSIEPIIEYVRGLEAENADH